MDRQSHGIVVGYDGSPGSAVALDWAAGMAGRRGQTLTVLYSFELVGKPVPPGFGAFMPTEPLEQAHKAILAEGVERATELLGDGQVTGLIVVGAPAANLVQASEGAEMVVTSCRGRGRLAAGLLGSVSYSVTAHAHSPAVVVRGDAPAMPGPQRKVVVGVDDSVSSERALELAAEIAASAGAFLQIVRVGTIHSPDAWAYAETSSAGTKGTHALWDDAEHTVMRARERMHRAYPELAIETEVLFGHPGHVMAELGEGAGLIVVGSRGRGGFTELVLGSVSHTVIHEAACPVMVVHA